MQTERLPAAWKQMFDDFLQQSGAQAAFDAVQDYREDE